MNLLHLYNVMIYIITFILHILQYYDEHEEMHSFYNYRNKDLKRKCIGIERKQ